MNRAAMWAVTVAGAFAVPVVLGLWVRAFLWAAGL
jgi:hypothetical protein